MSFIDMRRMVKTLSYLCHTSPAEVKQDKAMPSCFISHKCLLQDLFGTIFAGIFVCFVCVFVVLLIPMASKCSSKVLFIVRKPKKAVECLMKIRVLDKLLSGMSYSAGGHRISV